MKMVADKCNRCGRVVVKHNHADSHGYDGG